MFQPKAAAVALERAQSDGLLSAILCTAGGALLAQSVVPPVQTPADGRDAPEMKPVHIKAYAGIASNLWAAAERNVAKGLPGLERSGSDSPPPETAGDSERRNDVRVLMLECDHGLIAVGKIGRGFLLCLVAADSHPVSLLRAKMVALQAHLEPQMAGWP